MRTYEEWWDAVTAAAVLGSGRRGLPEPPASFPVRTGASAQTALLDAAALGGVLVRSGRPPATGDAPEPAGPDRQPVAPAQAVQLLELILTQAPSGAVLRDAALGHWLTSANTAGRRVPARLLPKLLDQALTRSDLHRAALVAADARGAWLVANRTKWRPLTRSAEAATAEDDVDTAAWAQRPTGARVASLTTLRARDPAAGRERLEAVWAKEKAADRATLLGVLATGLTMDDEAFLERALDDRSAVVRRQAQDLLDGLPDSARGARLAAVLRPLVSVSGRLRKTLEVGLPADPDEASRRDGLDAGPKGRSQRGYWLERLAAGAPLEVWTDATRRDPAATWRMIADADAREGIVRAVVARRDTTWAGAMVDDVYRSELLELVPLDEREAAVLKRLKAGKKPESIARHLDAMPAPWSLTLGRAVLAHLADEAAFDQVLGLLALRLPPTILPDLRRLPDEVARPRDRLVQHFSLMNAITEAFQ